MHGRGTRAQTSIHGVSVATNSTRCKQPIGIFALTYNVVFCILISPNRELLSLPGVGICDDHDAIDPHARIETTNGMNRKIKGKGVSPTKEVMGHIVAGSITICTFYGR